MWLRIDRNEYPSKTDALVDSKIYLLLLKLSAMIDITKYDFSIASTCISDKGNVKETVNRNKRIDRNQFFKNA